METNEGASVPPPQKEGVSKTLEEDAELKSKEEAVTLFMQAKDRLLNVDKWQEVSTTIKSRFRVVDARSTSQNRPARQGDYILIDIPGPGGDAGDGADWVCVDAIEYDDYPDENRELIALRLRPVSNPMNKDESAAHFFSDHATSSFVIERNQQKITARYYGRNETPNLEAEKVTDKVRNLAVALGAMLGFSDVQWSGLLQGFLKNKSADS